MSIQYRPFYLQLLNINNNCNYLLKKTHPVLHDFLRYLFAIGILLIGIGLRFYAFPIEAGYPHLTIYPAMVISFLVCGTGPGLLVMLLSAIATFCFFVPPFHSFEHSHETMVITSIYLFSSLIIGFIIHKSKTTLEQKNELTVERPKVDAKHHIIYEFNDDAVMLLNKECFFYCNKATLALFGCTTREKFYTQHPIDLSPEQQPCMTTSLILANQHITSAIEQGSHRYEWVYKRIDSEITFIAEVNLNVIAMEGELILQAIVRNITKRKKQEKIIFNQIQYTRSLIEASLDPFVVISTEGKITDVNVAMEVVTGLHRDQLIGSEFSNYFTDSARAKEIYERVSMYSFMTDHALSIRHVSGNLTDVRYNANVYRDSHGNITGIFAAARNITEQHWKNP